MKLHKIEFEWFRSFGPIGVIDFSDPLTFFIGKNHTGKSNLLKIFREIQLYNLPLNRGYVLSRNNWFNNESGVERPLKFKIFIDLNRAEYQDLCITLFIDPLHQELDDDTFSLPAVRALPITFEELMEYLPEKQIILRMEFIRFSDDEQEVNYSLEFNHFIVVNTHDGRQFIQNTRQRPIAKTYETKLWNLFLLETLRDIQEKIPPKDQGFEFLKTISANFDKYFFSSPVLNEYYRLFLGSLKIYDSTKLFIPSIRHDAGIIFQNPSRALNNRLANKILTSQERFINDAEFRNRYTKFTDQFEEIYEDLGISFGIISQNEIPQIIYYQRNHNQQIHNFDSIGDGITEMMNFLYDLIVEEEQIFFIENPEHNIHPHSQRNLARLIKTYSPNNQIILITHSPYFFQPEDLFHFRIFTLDSQITTVHQLTPPRNQMDYYRLKRNFSIRNRDAIFADGLIFVEGPSEDWSFPYLFETFGLDLDLNNLSLINIGGKGSLHVFWTFAHQLQKKYWFFFDNDVLGIKAGEIVTPLTFKASVIYKKRKLFQPKIRFLCENMILYTDSELLDFESDLEYLRILLEEEHIFVFPTDFEGMFESYLGDQVEFRGSKVDKSMQLIDFLKNHPDDDFLPERLYRYIQIIQDDLNDNQKWF